MIKFIIVIAFLVILTTVVIGLFTANPVIIAYALGFNLLLDFSFKILQRTAVIQTFNDKE